MPTLCPNVSTADSRPVQLVSANLREVRLVISGHLLSREALDVLLASRPLIEGHIRRRVLTLDNVTVRQRCDAAELVTSPDGRRVSGVRIRTRGGRGMEEACDADLTVAATGRSARVPRCSRHWAIGGPRRSGSRSTCST
jgi:2-polyprenyl-6-methoxyphenol hydroxylase-like FAD-dependent oxidoreductase